MAPHNEAIVRRSWGVLESASASSQVLAYGPKFQYREMMAMPNPVVAALFSVVIYLVGASLFVFAPLRNLVGRYAAQPGEGPSVDAQAKGVFPDQSISVRLLILSTPCQARSNVLPSPTL